MLKRYAIWNRQDDIYTPGVNKELKGLTYSTAAGTARYSAAEWLEIHPVPPTATVVCAAGDYNGAFFSTVGQMVAIYASRGVDFSACSTDTEKLEAIEAWEDAQNAPADPTESSPEERIAAALELANVMNMPTVNDDDPDAE